MSVVRRIIKDSIERVKVDELLYDEYEQAGYGGITLTKTPLGTQINLFAMRPGRVIGKRGKAIKEASERLETELGLPNPQITVVEVEVPEMNPLIMASRVANALERGVHFRRAIFWSLRRIMDSGALGCEVILRGPLRSARSRFEKVVEGYVPKAGEPAQRYVKKATIHVKMKRGVLGVTVKIVPPDAKFPDKVSLDNLPEIEYQQPIPGVEPDEAETEAGQVTETMVEEAVEPQVEEAVEPQVEEAVESKVPVEEEPVSEEPVVADTEAEELVPKEMAEEDLPEDDQTEEDEEE
ncbi:MAG: 30S ribosomal protein S3 [Candidatus Bathyarchaeota archaeon]